MKVLFTGYHNPCFHTITEYIEKAFVAEGHQCLPFDDRKFVLPGRVRSIVPPFQYWDIKRLNNRLIKLAEKTKPELCLVSGGHRILATTVERLKEIGIKTALWTVDCPTDFQPVLEAASLYDYLFCGGTEAVELFEAHNIKGAHWLPFGFDDEQQHLVVCSEEDKKKCSHDVVFIGSYYPNRLEVLQDLIEFDLGVWGPGWEKVPEDNPLNPSIHPAQLIPEEWMKIYQCAKIIIVVHYQDGKSPCYQASPKVYESLLSGQLVICDEQKDVKVLFEDKTHLVNFVDGNDLKEKIRYYLEHDEERKKISKAGRAAVIENHSYRHRIRKVMEIVNEKS